MSHVRDRLILGSRSDRAARVARHRRGLALEGLEPRVVLTQTAYGLFDTGVDPAGTALASGVADPHYSLVATPTSTSSTAATVAATLPGAWAANLPTARWIAPTANQASDANPVGTYRYRTTFTLTSVGGGTGHLTGSLVADNVFDSIEINGTSTRFDRASDLKVSDPFSVPATFVVGENSVVFVVANVGGVPNPTGLQASGLALDFAPTVAVDEATVTVGSGGTASTTGTFADLDPGDVVTLTSSQGTVTPTGTTGPGNSGTFTFTQDNVTVSGPVTITATDSRGNTRTATFAINVTPPTLTSGGNVVTARSGAPAVTVNPDLVVSYPGGVLATASVAIGANFTPAEDVLSFTPQAGITGSYNAVTGILTLTGSATPAQYQAALRSVQYQNTNADPVTANRAARSIAFSIVPGNYNPDNGHFYQFITAPDITWSDARAAALSSTLYGIKGYLATLTSDAENVFAFSKTQNSGWLGGSDAAQVGDWQWVDGPDAGLRFWNGLIDGVPVDGQFSSWDVEQPDNFQGAEFYVQYRTNGLWNDLADTGTVNGYLIEFGGSAGDPTLQLTATTTVDVTSVTNAPTVTVPASAVLTNLSTSVVAGAADAGSLVRIYNDSNNNGVVDAGEGVVATAQLAAGQAAYSIATPLTLDTVNHLLVTATFGTALESSPAAVLPITSDTIPPDAPVVNPFFEGNVVPGTDQSLAGTAEAGSLVQAYIDTNNNGVLDATDVVVGSQQLVAGATSFLIPVTLTPNAANQYLFTATDAAGNQSSPTPFVVINDSNAPVAPTVTDPAAALTVNAAAYTIVGTAEAGSTIRIYADPNRTGTIAGLQQVGLGTASAGGGFQVAVPLGANAPNDFLVVALDAVGNVSAPVVVPTITTDSLAPAAPVIGNPTNSLPAGSTSVTITGTAEAGSLVQIYADANQNGVLDAGEVLLGVVQLAPGAAAFEFNLPVTAGQVNDFVATAADAVGNTSGPAIAQAIIQASIDPPVTRTLVGQVFLNLAAGGFNDPTADRIPGRVLYLDLDNSGIYKPGDPVTTSDVFGNFNFGTVSFTVFPTLRELSAQDVSYRYVVAQRSFSSNGLDYLGVTPFSPVFPVAVVPNPFTDLTATDNNANYVQALYKAVLGRTGSDVEIAAWTATMAAGATDAQVATRIVNSPEHRQAQVAFYYQAYLHRGIDPGSSSWVDLLLAGASDQDVSAGILNSAEYQSAQADRTTLIRDLYLDVLGRVGGDSEVNAYLSVGTSPSDLVDTFVNSLEGDSQLVQGLYSAALRRARESAGSAIWVNALTGRTSAGAVAAGILSSPEFRSRAIASPIPNLVP